MKAKVFILSILATIAFVLSAFFLYEYFKHGRFMQLSPEINMALFAILFVLGFVLLFFMRIARAAVVGRRKKR